MKSYEILQKDLEAEQAKRRDAVKRAAKAEADLVVMSEACGQSAAHIKRVEADAAKVQREADRLAAELQLMRDALDDLRAKANAERAAAKDDIAALAGELNAIRAEAAASRRAERDALGKLKEANKRLASYGGAAVE